MGWSVIIIIASSFCAPSSLLIVGSSCRILSRSELERESYADLIRMGSGFDEHGYTATSHNHLARRIFGKTI